MVSIWIKAQPVTLLAIGEITLEVLATASAARSAANLQTCRTDSAQTGVRYEDSISASGSAGTIDGSAPLSLSQGNWVHILSPSRASPGFPLHLRSTYTLLKKNLSFIKRTLSNVT
jgi:hypothetical protein